MPDSNVQLHARYGACQILALALAPANEFIAEGNIHSQSHNVVLKSYTFWMKIYVLGIIGCAVIGFLYVQLYCPEEPVPAVLQPCSPVASSQ